MLFRDQCYFFRDYPYDADFAGSSRTDADTFCASFNWVGDTGRVVLPLDLQTNYFIERITAGYVHAVCI